ncbi:MAG: ATP-dependent helicase [Bacteroidales bacterium]|nr:ATP-dependent helicase [Bacteroidales bacterium]
MEDSTPEAIIPVVTLGEFLENISLLSNVDMAEEEDTNNKVALMTAHSAKGLEFPYVYIAGMEENLFPSANMLSSSFEIEEERRLFYVAVTRAKKAVALSFATTRMRNGRHESNSPSRFIREIDQKYLANPLTDREMDDDDDGGYGFGFGGFGSRFGRGASGSTFGYGGRDAGANGQYRYGGSSSVKYIPAQRPARPSAPSRPVAPSVPSRHPVPAAPTQRYDEATFVPSPMRDFSIGQRIEHNRFGPGRILDITGEFPELKAKIAFDDYPEPKTILLKYAKMRPEQKS